MGNGLLEEMTEEELVHYLRGNPDDEQVFQMLWARLSKDIQALIRSKGFDSADSEDLFADIQMALLEEVKRRHNYNGKSRFKSYVQSMALHTINNLIRRKIRERMLYPRHEEHEIVSDSGPVYFDPVNKTLLKKILRRLETGSPGLRNLHLEVHLLESQSEENAWAIPPNKIYLTQGLLNFVERTADFDHLTEDVFAFILGHEIAHLAGHDDWKKTISMYWCTEPSVKRKYAET